MLDSASQPPAKADKDHSKLSRKLAYVLRHGAARLQLPVNSAGFVSVTSLRADVPGLESLTHEKLQQIVDNDRKQRFGLWTDHRNNLHVRANQGHSDQVAALIHPHDLLRPLSSADIPDICVHGTTLDAWSQIQKTGLSRMNRDMIHFATGLPQDENVVSGMRATSEVLVYVCVAAAIEDGIPFYRSENNVILSPGIADTGVLPVQYFEKVIRRDTGQLLASSSSIR